jgi:hypothetical protein
MFAVDVPHANASVREREAGGLVCTVEAQVAACQLDGAIPRLGTCLHYYLTLNPRCIGQ